MILLPEFIKNDTSNWVNGRTPPKHREHMDKYLSDYIPALYDSYSEWTEVAKNGLWEDNVEKFLQIRVQEFLSL